MKSITIGSGVFVFLYAILCEGCTLNLTQDNELTDPKAVYDVSSAYELLSSAYDELPDAQLQLSLLASDFEPLPMASNDKELRNLYYWQSKEIRELAQSLWEGYYRAISSINLIEERSTLLGEKNAAYHYLMGEVYTLKAYVYLELLSLFSPAYVEGGGAPAVVLKSLSHAETLPRSTQSEVLTTVFTLLDRADEHFESASDFVPEHKGDYYVSSETARAVRVRTLLFQGDYSRALEVCSELLARRPQAPWRTDLVFWVNTPHDALFVQSRRTRIYTEFYHDYAAWRSNKFAVATALIFDKGDKRLGTYVLSNEGRVSYAPETTQLMGKYNYANMERQEPLMGYRIRWSEMEYIRAEALARLGREDEARRALAACRQLLGLDDSFLSDLRTEELLHTILTDKRKEFIGEGINFLDAKRLRATQRRAGGDIKGDDYRYTFPIPKSEYAANPAIKEQNPGWPAIGIK